MRHDRGPENENKQSDLTMLNHSDGLVLVEVLNDKVEEKKRSRIKREEWGLAHSQLEWTRSLHSINALPPPRELFLIENA